MGSSPHLRRLVATPGDEASIRKDHHTPHVIAVPREGRHGKTRAVKSGLLKGMVSILAMSASGVRPAERETLTISAPKTKNRIKNS